MTHEDHHQNHYPRRRLKSACRFQGQYTLLDPHVLWDESLEDVDGSRNDDEFATMNSWLAHQTQVWIPGTVRSYRLFWPICEAKLSNHRRLTSPGKKSASPRKVFNNPCDVRGEGHVKGIDVRAVTDLRIFKSILVSRVILLPFFTSNHHTPQTLTTYPSLSQQHQ